MNTLVVPAGRLQAALDGLLTKYAVAAAPARLAADAAELSAGDAASGGRTLAPGWLLPADHAALPLAPWRFERRFVELKRLVETGTVEHVVMARFACQTDGRALDLAGILYREFDLAEWILGSPIASIAASGHAGRLLNVVARLQTGTLVGLEGSAALPAGAAPLDRHELIARRGVACDRVVDTQWPQQSIYAVTADGLATYTDVDAELFGLSYDDVHLVRAAYAAAASAVDEEAVRRQHARLRRLVELCQQAAAERRRIDAETVR